MNKQFIALLIAAVAFPIAAQAAQPGQQSYMGVDVGHAERKLSVDGDDYGKENKTSFKLYGGFNYSQYFGVEVGYANFDKIRTNDNASQIDLKTSAVYVAATGTWPVTPEFALFGKVGITSNQVKGSIDLPFYSGSGTKNQASALFGAGASYRVTRNVALVVEYEDFGKLFKDDGIEIKANTISGGVRYSF